MKGFSQDELEALRVGDEMTTMLQGTEMGGLLPVDLYEALSRGRQYSFLLESLEGEEKIARYSILGFDPFLRFQSKRDAITVSAGGKAIHARGDPITILQDLMSRIRVKNPIGSLRFSGGAVGYFGYDMVRFFEELPDTNPDDLNIPDCYLIFPRQIVVFDHRQKSITMIYSATDERKDRAISELNSMKTIIAQLKRGKDKKERRANGKVNESLLQSNLTQKQFEEVVDRAKEYIFAGDIFQVVLSQRFSVQIASDPLQIFRTLRRTNPSPYMYYLNFGRLKIIGSSPEILVRVEDGFVETRPLAGTRPRGNSAEEDGALIKDLLSDEKERAEHIMLVDLGRNDIGRVCEYGSVKVTELLGVEKYSHVIHLVSNVVGRLRRGKDAFDVLRATFPAGTVSGAPKVRAMEIIDELEPVRRGIYAGAVGYVSFTGNLDTCIAIRTIVIKDGRAFIQAGAGIVADSVPEREYGETMDKAQALFRAMEIADGTLDPHPIDSRGEIS